jgi:DNA-binding Lrp family transcriptional regulator
MSVTARRKNDEEDIKKYSNKGNKSMVSKLDKIDLTILQNLQVEGRVTNVELAKRAGISAPPCLRRVKALEDEGIIQGYYGVLNPQALGYTVFIFAEVTLTSQNDADLRDFEDQVQKWPMVRECYMVTGGSDFLLKVVAEDFDDYQKFLSTQLTTLPKVAQVKTRMVVRSSKKLPGVPVETLVA